MNDVVVDRLFLLPGRLFLAPAAPKAAQDLLAGISMSQLFSQPSATPTAARSRPPAEVRPTTPTVAASSPAKPPTGQGGGGGGASRNRPVLKWWERQTTTELEVAGIVDDVINPTLLAAGRAAEPGGGKGMAVASLRELWDEEKERSRLAGGGSQLSAPPGLELADSQDAWQPPEGLLTQHMKDEVEGLARNVLRRTATGSQETGGSSQPQPSQQPRSSQGSVGGNNELLLERSEEEAEMTTPSRNGVPLSQAAASAADDGAAVAGASSSPANYLPSPGGMGDEDVDQGLLDMITALRGGSQQSQGKEGESPLSPPLGRGYSQSSSGPLSQKPAFTPESSADQAEAVAATQVPKNAPTGSRF